MFLFDDLDIKMHKAIDVKDIKLRSINKKFYSNFRLTVEYKTFKMILVESLILPPKQLTPPYFVSIFIKTYLDIDNPLKAILDSLEGPVIDNDRNIDRLYIDRNRLKKGRDSSLVVYVGSLLNQQKVTQ